MFETLKGLKNLIIEQFHLALAMELIDTETSSALHEKKHTNQVLKKSINLCKTL